MIEDRSASPLTGRLPRVIAATFLVAVVPSLAVFGLQAGGVISSALVSTVLAAVISLVLCYVGGLYWEHRRDSNDVLFGDLMIWAWVRRGLTERRLANVMSLLGRSPTQLRDTRLALGTEQRKKLLERLATDLELRDPYTHGHSNRVARYSSLIAARMGLPPAEVARIRAAAAVHDVGKLHTPVEVLHKPGRLTDEEFGVVRRHASDGARMIALLVEDDELTSMVRHHHERLDGTGYPSRLSGDEIPLGARIIAVADTFDAITSERPYRSSKPHKAAIDILKAESGTQLDPDAVSAFCKVYFGRRPLGALVTVTNGGERLVSGLIGQAAGTAAQAVAIGATATALGAGALSLAPTASQVATSLHSANARVGLSHAAAARSTASTPVSAGRGGAAGHSRPSAGGGAAQQRSGNGSAQSGSRSPATGTIRGNPTPGGQGGGTAGGPTSGGPAPTTGGLGGTVNAGGSGSPTVNATVGVSSSPTVSTHVGTGGSGSPSVGTTLSTGGSPGVGATISSGGSGSPAVGVSIGGGAAPKVAIR